jgi:hypothetical protein
MVHEVVEGAQEEHHVDRVLVLRQGSCVPNLGGDPTGRRPGLIDVELHGVNEVHTVAERSEPGRIDTRTSAHIENLVRPGIQITQYQLLCSG